MAEDIFSDVTNEELDLSLLFDVLSDEEEDADWKEWARDNFVTFIAEQAEEGVFHNTFEWWHAFILNEFFESLEPIQIVELRRAQIDGNLDAWNMWMMSLAMNLHEEDQYRFDLVTDMFEVNWHNNEFTHGCYGPVDFWEDLSTVELEDLKLIRGAQLADVDKADYDALCDRIFGIV